MKNKKKIQFKSLMLGIVIGGIIFGSIGALATTYVLQSSEIQYKDNKSVQQAIEELFVKAENCGTGSSETLPVTDASVAYGTQINITYTGIYTDIKCLYGTDENYGNLGNINNDICTFTGNPNTKYYYKIIASNNDGKIYESSGNITTSEGTNVVLNDLPTGVKAIIYLNPTNLSAVCNAANSTSTTGTKSGCMKWYAYKEDSSSYTMILDHNTTANVNGWRAASTQLTTDTTGWSGSPRLITGQEVAYITGISWTSTSGSTSFRGSNTPSDYYWLYDYTYNCTSYGCKIADNSTKGYWTSTSESSSSAWHVYYDGRLLNNGNVSYALSGVRPVITISKSNF